MAMVAAKLQHRGMAMYVLGNVFLEAFCYEYIGGDFTKVARFHRTEVNIPYDGAYSRVLPYRCSLISDVWQV
jgi:hypothetical protein